MPQADDTAVKDDAVVENTATEDSATEVQESSQVEEKDVMEQSLEELSQDDQKETEDKEESNADDTADSNESDETDTTTEGDKPLAPKSENRFQKLANENKELKTNLENPEFLAQQLAQIKAKEAEVATRQELLETVNPETGEYFTPQEVERIAAQQANETYSEQLAQERYSLEVANNQQAIKTQVEKALEQFQMFDSDSKEYNAELTAKADAILAKALIWDTDAQGNQVLVGSQLDPYEIYQTIAEATQAVTPKVQAQAQKATETMLANADRMGSASTTSKPKVDPMVAAFDEEAGF